MDVVSLGFRTDLALLELAGSQVEQHADHLVVRTPSNPTFWWGNFLLLKRLPAPGEVPSWLERFAQAFPGAQHLAIGVDVPNGTVTDLDGFARAGLGVEASSVMTAREVREPRRRGEVAAECRPLATDEDWQHSVELSLRCHDPDEDAESARTAQRVFVSAKARANRGLVEAGHAQWFGAFIEGRLVAQLGLVTAARGLARFQSVETDPAFRRQGLAGALVHRAGRWGLDEAGAEVLVMVADPDYFAVDLYRALGFEATETQLQVQGRST